MTQQSIIRTAPRALATALALALAIPVVAADQPDRASGQDRGQDRGQDQGQGQRGPDRGGNQPGRQSTGRTQGPAQPQGQAPRAQRQPTAPAATAPSPWQQRGQPGAQGQAGQNRGQMPSRPVQQRSYQAAPALQAPTRPAPRPAYVQSLRRNIQVQQRYRAGSYQAPQGYAQRRWSYGQRLPRSYYARNYWIGNYLLYALFAPPSGLVWVRVGHDALLIDRYDGEIIQVRYNVFY